MWWDSRRDQVGGKFMDERTRTSVRDLIGFWNKQGASIDSFSPYCLSIQYVSHYSTHWVHITEQDRNFLP